MENVKKVKFVADVYGLLWLSFCMEIKIHDEYNRRNSSLVWKQKEKLIGNEDHMVWEGASIEEGFNFYDVVAHVVGHR